MIETIPGYLLNYDKGLHCCTHTLTRELPGNIAHPRKIHHLALQQEIMYIRSREEVRTVHSFNAS